MMDPRNIIVCSQSRLVNGYNFGNRTCNGLYNISIQECFSDLERFICLEQILIPEARLEQILVKVIHLLFSKVEHWKTPFRNILYLSLRL